MDDKQFEELGKELNEIQPPAPQDEIETGIDQIADVKAQKINVNLYAAQKSQPDIRAEAIKYSQKYALPADMVERNIETFRQRESAPNVDPYSIIKSRPGLARYLETQDNAIISKDDMGSLGKIEDGVRRLPPSSEISQAVYDIVTPASQAVRTGFTDLELSTLNLGVAYGLVDAETAAETAAELSRKRSQMTQAAPDFVQEFNKTMEQEGQDIGKAAEQVFDSIEAYRRGRIRDAMVGGAEGAYRTMGEVLSMVYEAGTRPKGLAYTVLQNLASSSPALVTGAIGGAAGGATPVPGGAAVGFVGGAFAGEYAVEVGAWFNQALEQRGIDTTNVEQLRAAYRDPQLMAQIRGEAERKGLGTAAVSAMFNALGGRLLKGATGAKQVAIRGAGELAIQSTGEAVSEAAGQAAAYQDIGRIDWGEVTLEGIVSMGHSLGEMAVRPAAEAVGAAVSRKTKAQEIRESLPADPIEATAQMAEQFQMAESAVKNAQILDEVVKTASQSKVKQRVEGKIGELIRQIDPDGDVATVYFQEDDFDSYWSQKGLSPIQAADQMMGDGGQAYIQAKETGQMIAVPIDKYVEVVSKDEAAAAELAKIARLEPNGMSLEEAREYRQSLPELGEQLRAEIIRAQEQGTLGFDEEAQEIANELGEQIQAAGRPAREVRRVKELIASSFTALAQRSEQTPRQLFEKYGVRILGPEVMAVIPERVELASGESVLEQGGYTYNDESGDYASGNVEANIQIRSEDNLNDLAPGLADIVGGEALEVNTLEVPPDQQGQGLGSKALRDIEQIAANQGQQYVVLKAEPLSSPKVGEAKPSNLKKLLKFYERNGYKVFKKNKTNAIMYKELGTQPSLGQGGQGIPGPNELGFYSRLERTVMDKVPNSATPDQIKGTLRDIKPEEMKWSGLDEFLKGKDKVSKAELLEFLRANQVEIVEVVKGGAGAQTKFSQYTLPGGENYREVLLTMPPKELTEFTVRQSPTNERRWQVVDQTGKVESEYFSESDAQQAVKFNKRYKTEGFTSSHFDEKNILAHMRLDDRVDADGKKVLHVNEIQSDWHQAGRERGYRGDELPGRFVAYYEANGQKVQIGYGDTEQQALENADPNWKNIVEIKVERETTTPTHPVPDAPFKQTDAWVGLALKRIIRMAAENGYDRVTWSKGEQVVNYFPNIAEVLNTIEWRNEEGGAKSVLLAPKSGNDILVSVNGKGIVEGGQFAGKTLAEVVGKDAAAQIMSAKESGEMKASDVSVSAQAAGMRKFYDDIVVKNANKLVKKFGGKVGDVSVIAGRNVSTEIFELGEYVGMPDEIANRYGTSHRERLEIQELKDGSWRFVDFNTREVLKSFKSRQEMQDALDFLIAREAGQQAKVHSIDITPELREAAINEGFSLFQQGRGRIRFGSDRKFTIELLKNADPSTLLHELGHFYLEVLGDLAQAEGASSQITDDFKTLLDWFGVSDRSQITVEHHEQFARGFEAYLMEGKAPSSKLRKAFASFKQWLISVYRNIKNLNIELNDDVRRVFDRMLVADDLTNRALENTPSDPLFVDPKAVGMSDAEAARYLEMREEARLAAEGAIRQKVFKDFELKTSKEYKQREAKHRADFTKQAEEMPVFNLISHLQKNKKADGSALPEGTLPMKLSKQDVIARFGEAGLNRLPRGVTSPNGLPLDMVAPMYGYQSPEMMYNDMVQNPSMKAWIDERVTAATEATAPNAGAQFEAMSQAVELAHTDARERMLKFELEWMAKNDLPAFKNMTARLIRRLPRSQDAKAQAQKMLGQVKVKDVRPDRYLQAERRYAAEAAKAWKAGDIEAAFDAKYKELLNSYLYTESMKARRETEKSLQFFKKLRKSDEDLAKTRETDFINAARAVLAMYGLDRTEKPASEYFDKIQKYDPMAYETVRGMLDSVSLDAGPYKQVPLDQFRGMTEAVEAMWDLSKTAKEFELENQKVKLDQALTELKTRINEVAPQKNKPGMKRAVTKYEKVQMKFLGFKSAMTRVEHWIETYDKKFGGAFRRYLWEPIQQGVQEYRAKKKDMLERYRKHVEAYQDIFQDRGEIAAPELDYIFKDKVELLGAILHSGNDSNLSKLLRGYMWGDLNPDGSLNRKRWDNFTARMYQEGKLTARDMEFIQGVWDIFEGIKPDLQRAHKKMFGFYFSEVTANEIKTPFGTYRGGYAPAKVDALKSETAQIRREAEEFEQKNPSIAFPTTGKGATMKRVEAFAAPLNLDLNIVGSHIDWAMRFAYIEPKVKEVNKIMLNQGFRAELEKLDPNAAKDMFVPWLKRVATQSAIKPSTDAAGRGLDAISGFLRRNLSMQVMTFNVTNTLQQFTGLIVAMTKVKPRHIRNALGTYVFSPSETAEYIQSKSKWMKNNQDNTVYEAREAIDAVILNPSTFDRWQQFSQKHQYFLQTAAQNQVNNIVWLGAYNQAIEAGSSDAQAIKQADAAVRLTQGSAAVEDISEYETGTQTSRLFKQFVGYFNMLANLNASELKKIANDIGLSKKQKANRAFYVYLTGFMIPAVLSQAVVQAMRADIDEDDDDEYLDDAMSVFFGSQVRTLTAMAPYVGPWVQAGINSFNDKQFDDRMNLAPAINVLEQTAQAPKSIVDALEDDRKAKKAVKDSLLLLGVLTGLPAAPLGRPIGYMLDVESGKAEPTGPIDFTRGLITGQPGGQ